jgi:LacI family transcriptional regulator
MAIGALSALREAGVRVPDDMALGGFDDIPMARYMDPALSTVSVDISALGEHAALRLLAAVRNKDEHQPRAETLPTNLVLRRSSGARVSRSPAKQRTPHQSPLPFPP